MAAGDLHAREGIVTLDGAAATVAWVRTVPGQADMYNLTVVQDHTFAVGDVPVVVHNTCGDLIKTAEKSANDEGRRSATSMRVEDAEGNPVALPRTTFTSNTAVTDGPFQDIIQRELDNGSRTAGGCGERFACGALYDIADQISGGYVEMGLWHEKGIGPCSACQSILQRTANELGITIYLEADGQSVPLTYEPDWS